MGIFSYKDSISDIRDIASINIFSECDTSLVYTFGIVTYKRRHDLKETIDSVLAQKVHIKYNLLIIDDCPERNDETEQLISQDYASLSNLTYIKNAVNLGQAGNWNRLFVFCKTKYLIMLHDDDVLLPSFLERMDFFLKKNPTASAINSGKIEWDGSPERRNVRCNNSDRYFVFNRYMNFPAFYFKAPSGCLFNVQDVVDEGGFDPDTFPSIDYVLIQKLCLKEKLLLLTEEPLMLYRVVGNASSKLQTQIKWLEIEYKIKEELGLLLNLPSWYISMVIFFNTKIRLRTINRLQVNYVYKGYTQGGNIFLVFQKCFTWLYKITYLNSHRILVK